MVEASEAAAAAAAGGGEVQEGAPAAVEIHNSTVTFLTLTGKNLM